MMWRFIFTTVAVVAAAVGYFIYQEIYAETPHTWNEEPRKRRRQNTTRREEILKIILNDTLSCMICMDKCKKHDAVWFCSHCFANGHVKCMTDWADAQGSYHPDITCPSCREQIEVPIKHTCLCGRSWLPVYNNSNNLPHSCGGKCSKNCGDDCHPGSCTTF